MTRTIRSILCVVVFSLGCSGSEEDTGGGDNADEGADGLALEDLDDALGDAYCDRMFGVEACCSAEDKAFLFPVEGLEQADIPTDLASCKAYYAKHAMLADHIKDSVAAGRITYDGKVANDCVGRIKSSCEFGSDVIDPLFQAPSFWISTSVPSFCEGMVKPKDGAKDCLESIDCAVEEFCARPPVECVEKDGVIDCSGVAPPGKCEARARSGESCDNAQCSLGLSCPFLGEERICQVPAADGESCFIGNECATGHCGDKTDLNDSGVCAAPPVFCGGPSAD